MQYRQQYRGLLLLKPLHTHVCTRTCATHAHTYAQVHTHVHTHARTHMRMQVCTHTHTRTYAQTHVFMHAHTHMHKLTHLDTHTYTHTHTRALARHVCTDAHAHACPPSKSFLLPAAHAADLAGRQCTHAHIHTHTHVHQGQTVPITAVHPPGLGRERLLL